MITQPDLDRFLANDGDVTVTMSRLAAWRVHRALQLSLRQRAGQRDLREVVEVAAAIEELIRAAPEVVNGEANGEVNGEVY